MVQVYQCAKVLIAAFFLAISMYACKKTVVENYIFELLNYETTGIDFENTLDVNMDLNIFNYMYYYNGAGVAVADFNNDGFTDIIFTSNLGEEKMYLNQGGLKFKDVSLQTNIDGGPNGFTTGVTVADINGDGLIDIYLCQSGNYRQLKNYNKLFICTHIDDNGVPQYKESAAEYGLDFSGFSTMAGFFDYDLDGDLDLFLMNHSLHHNGTFGMRREFLGKVDSLSGDRLYRNDNGKFTDVTIQAGIQSMVIGYGLGLSFSDVNQDGYPDIYIGNDFHENDYLYINNGDGTFTESLEKYISHTSKFSMGTDIADINNDLLPDIISLDMLPEDPFILKKSEGEDDIDIFNFKLKYGYHHQYSRNCLQINNGNGTFNEAGRYAGIYATDWSWASLFLDINLDGIKDIFITNGIPRRMNDIDYINFISGNDIQYKIQFDDLEDRDLSVIEKIPEIKIKNKFYLGSASLQFQDIGTRVKNDQISYSNSAAYADFDNDGDLDIVVNNINDKAFLYKNKSIESGSKSIKIQLKGSPMNHHAIGAKIIVWQDQGVQYFENWQTRGFQSSMLGDIIVAKTHAELDSLLVIWPDNKYMVIYKATEDLIKLEWNESLPKFDYSRIKKTFHYQLQSLGKESGITYSHKENPFIEFDREKLIPHSTSSEGPALAVGDLNGDGIDDIFIGSSKFYKPILYLSTSDGKYVSTEMPIDSSYEEVDAQIIDINKDGFADLIIATGGNEFRHSSPYTAPLLFINDGKGKMSFIKDAFPDHVRLTASTIQLFDFNKDGLPDLFIGSRAVPWAYGEVPKSYFLLNKGNNKFEDVTDKTLPNMGKIGFIKNSYMYDIDNDGTAEIFLAEEWGPVRYLKYEKGSFTLKTVYDKRGWWNDIKVEDLNGDGLVDIIVTNQGYNNILQPTTENPVIMYYADFDDNGTSEQLLTYYRAGQRIVFSNIRELHKQLPVLKKKFIKAEDFAKSDFKKWFPKEKYTNFLIAEDFNTVILINDGKGGFQNLPLPPELQKYYLTAIHTADLNNDGWKDILIMGNYYGANIQMGRYDNCFGLILENRQGKSFDIKLMDGDIFGGQVKRIIPVKGSVDTALGVAVNSEPFRLIDIRHKK